MRPTKRWRTCGSACRSGLRDDRGTILVFGAFVAVILAGALYGVVRAADLVLDRELAQDAADGAAYNAAALAAEGMNGIALLNVVGLCLVAVGMALKASWLALSTAMVTAVDQCSTSRPSRWVYCTAMMQIPMALAALDEHSETATVRAAELSVIARDAQAAVAMAVPLAAAAQVADDSRRFTGASPGMVAGCALNAVDRLPIRFAEPSEDCGVDQDFIDRLGHMEALRRSRGIEGVPRLMNVAVANARGASWLRKGHCHWAATLEQDAVASLHTRVLIPGDQSEPPLGWPFGVIASPVLHPAASDAFTLAQASALPDRALPADSWLWHPSFRPRLSRFDMGHGQLPSGVCVDPDSELLRYDLDAVMVH